MRDGAIKLRSGRAALRRGAGLGLLWLGLVGPDPEGLALGLAAVPAAVWLSLALMPPGPPLPLRGLLAMLPGFHWRSLVGGLDVARRVGDPRLPLAPGWVVQPLALPPGARVALGAELSLMPGTLAAGSEGGTLLVHVLDRHARPGAALRAEAGRIAALLPGEGAGP